MNSVYDIYYELLSEENNKNLKNELILEEGKSALKEIYKFKFSALNGADELNPEGKKALDAIKNIIETSDNGKLYDLINLKINEYLKVIESSFNGFEEESTEEPDSSNDENETKENETLDDEPNENNDDELAEEPSEANKSNENNDDELAEEPSKETKSKDDGDDELAEEPSEANKSKDDDDDELAE